MKRRLLAFFLAFAMMVSLMPVSTFAAEEETETPFTSIVTDSGEEVTAKYVKTVQTTSAWSESIDAPYYHATIPEGTQNVLVTYPKGTALYSDSGDTNLNFFIMSVADSTVDHGQNFSAEVNEDGSTTVTIPVEHFILNEDGTGIAAGMACTSDSGSLNAVNFFSFSYAAKTPVSHTVTLTSGEGYTLAGETTAEDGKDYSFTLSVADGYEKTDAFAVKANDKALTANSDGSYTVEAVSADLTITVEGVAKKQTEPEQPFTSILTKDDQEVTVEYMATVPFTLNGVTYADAPYYHVTVPAKTRSVYVTYPADVEFDADGVAFTYALTIPDYTAKVGLVGYSVKTNSDGSKLVCIDVEDFLLDDNGAGKAVSLKYSGSQDPVSFFSFSYDPQTVVTHSVKLPTGEGYTLKGETTVQDGDDYTFTITIADGYEKTDSFAVKVNGNTVQPNANGDCTVKSVSADLTVTVEGVAKKQTVSTKPFTSIVTNDGKEVTLAFKGMIPCKTDYATYNDAPYYHVTVPAGTKSVLVTYPASAVIAGGSTAYTYTLSVPAYVMNYGDANFAVTTNDDGTKTMTIPVASFVLDGNGKGTATSAEYSGSFDPITFFSFAYEGGATVSHTVTLTAGDGYTLTGKTTVEEGGDYSFTIAITDGYEKTDAFAVKANGEALTANSDGSYTVKSVSADLTITVEGVAEKQTNLFSGIVTDSGKEVTVEYQGKVLAKNDYSSYENVPYYHVTVPAETSSVQITYPASVDMMGTNTAYGYTLTIPDHVLDWTSSGFDFTTNDDGSKTVTIPIADYLLDADGKGTAVSVEYNNYAPIDFFTFAYEPAVTHKVNLSSGSGYTLTGADTVEDGADYTFRLEITDGYGKGDSFAVRANGTTLTANEDGTYTVKNVTSDLRISVSGVYAAYTVYLPESRDGYTLTDYVTGEELPSSFKLAMTKKYEIKVTLKDGYAVRSNDYGVDFTVGMVARTDTYDGYAVITIQTVTGDGRIAIKGVKQLVNITLPEGEGYTVAPTKSTSNPVLSGDYYYFAVTIADGYEKTDAFAVKANGETLTANQSGNYTAKNFGADLTITVEGVAKKQTTPEVPFTAIVTDNDEELTAEYVETVSAESAQDGTITAPYYHVVVPAGTEYVKVTYPESAALYQATEGSVYWCGLTLPGHTSGRGQSFPAEPNEDGSVTAIIYVSNFILNEDGTGAAVGVVSAEDSGNFTTPNFFSFSYAAKPVTTHTVTLTAGTGYTLTGDTTVADGESYTFKLTVSSGYGKSDDFVVKANGEVLTANADGSYTVNNVTSDLTVTVKGVTQLHTITLPKSRSKYTITDYTTGEELGLEVEVAEGQKYQFKVTPKDGYAVRDKDFKIDFDSIYNKIDIEENDDYAIITVSKIVEDDKMSNATGVKKIIKVTAAEGEGYTIVPDENMKQPLLKGDNYSFKVVISDGYEKSDDFAVTGVYSQYNYVRDLVEKNGFYTIEAIQEDHTIHVDGVVKAAPSVHTVTLTAGTGYTLTGDTTVADGESYTFKLTVSSGYGKSDDFVVKANGEVLTANADGSYTVNNVTSDLTVTVKGVTQLHTITLPTSRKGYAITDYTSGEELGTELEIAEGQTYKFKITLKDGYAVRNKDFNIQYNSIYNVVKIEEDDASAVITMSKVVEDDKMTIKGVKKILNVTVPEGEGYTVVPDESKMTLPILSGENYYFKVVIADGYAKSDDFAVQAISKNGTRDLTEVDGLYTIPNPTQDQEIKVTGVIKRTVSHTVTLTPGTGYTLTGETTVEDGADYSFTVTVAEGYVKSGEYAVKADDKELKANEDGSYTVKNVTANVTVTVEGLMTPPANGLSALRFTASSGSSAKAFDMTPAFDPAVKEYTILIPDSESALYAWAKLSEGLSSKGTIQAEWISQTGSSTSTKTQVIKSGASYGQSLSGTVSAGDKTCTVSIKITDGEYTDSYTVTTVRTDPTLKSLNLDTVKLNKTFASSTKVYTATTVDESVTVNAVPRSSSYTVTINGKSDKTVALEMGENVIEIVVENARGDKNTYTVTVTRVAPIAVTLDVTPAGAKVSLTDAKGAAISPDSDGVYHLMSGSTYYYTANAKGYKRTTGSFTLTESGSAKIEMEVDTSKPVTVYFSFSHDDKFELCEETGAVMALKKVTVPYFDLANYGMEGFYFKSENYGAVNPDKPGQGSALEPGTAEYAYGKVTMLHLFIYATEVYYCGIDPDDAGQGYLYDNGLLGTDLFSYSGSTGSIFLQTIWNYDLNLNYYLNHEYPLASAGWGSTCDQILLHDDDVVTLGHFTDWSFFNDSTSVFNHFEADNATPTQGDQITLSVIRDGADMSGNYTTGHDAVTYCPKIYCAPVDEVNDGDVTTWTYVGTADEEGHLTVDTSDLAPGEYIFAMAGQPGAENPDAICSTPGGMRITVLAKTATKGDVDGDGDVDAMDATALYNAISNGDATDAAVSDFNGDGVVDIFDVMALYASVASGK